MNSNVKPLLSARMPKCDCLECRYLEQFDYNLGGLNPCDCKVCTGSDLVLSKCRCASCNDIWDPCDCKVCHPDLSVSNVISDVQGKFGYWIKSHNSVKKSGCHNYKGCRLEVHSKMNIDRWRYWMGISGHNDRDLVDLLQFGWPLGYDLDSLPHSSKDNHTGATIFKEETSAYINSEINNGAIIGPFMVNPLDSSLVTCPINSIPKKGSNSRRFISDLSYPKGNSVNDGINLDNYLGNNERFSYPTVDNLVDTIKKFGKGSLIFKKDLSRAFRQFAVDPGDINLQGFKWDNSYYIDCALVMGCRSSAMMCQRATSAICSFMRSQGVSIISYLDDFAGCSPSNVAQSDYDCLGSMLIDLGLSESLRKAEPPASRMEFLGITFDTETLTLEITPSRLIEIHEILSDWSNKRSATKKELQSLIGKLQFAAKCVPAGRIFISRLLDSLHGLKEQSHKFRITLQFRKDLNWWSSFMNSFNGVEMMLDRFWSKPDAVLSTDACLKGGGGWISGEYFSFPFPDSIRRKNWHINILELLVMMVAIKLWSARFSGQKIQLYCDNEATVYVINTGRCKDPIMLNLVREIVFHVATNNFTIRAVHIQGTSNRLADMLSRREDLSITDTAKLDSETASWSERVVNNELFLCQNDW